MLDSQGYIADRDLATSVYLAIQLRKPLLIEGAAGVGKTEVAKVMARALETDLIRLQCYEGLDATTSLYEWNYQRQLLHIRLQEHSDLPLEAREREIFSEPFLLKRPLLAAITHHKAPVLLIDETDRADEEWEAFLLEVLSEFAVTIPEIGRVAAEEPPVVIVTSNRTRELHDALKRRCLYHWIDHPALDREIEIIRARAPEVPEVLARDVASAVSRLRGFDIAKRPGVAETIDWANCLVALDRVTLDPETVNNTLGVLLKYRDDLERIAGEEAERLVGEAKAAAAA